MKYEAVGFDWGGVLNGKPGKFLGESISSLLGVTHEEYLDAYFKHNSKVNKGEISWEELWTLVLSEFDQEEKVQEVLTLSLEATADNLNQDVLDLVDNLKDMGYKVGLLSNNTIEKAARMREAELDKHFDVFHISAETGLVKPNPEAFRHLADELGVDLKALIFIDDIEKSLSTAQECGYTPILFESYPQLRRELGSLGINAIKPT